MSDTPRTDEVQNRHWNTCSPDAVFRLGNHARQLERELATVTAMKETPDA